MKRQLVRETVVNKRTLLFYHLESGSYTLVVERSGMSWGSFATLEETEAFARRPQHPFYLDLYMSKNGIFLQPFHVLTPFFILPQFLYVGEF